MDNEMLLKRIKDLCETKGKTISELERRVDVSNSTIARWGRSNPSADKLSAVANELGTTMDYLVNGKNEASESAKVLAREANSLTDTQQEIILNMIRELKNKG